MAELCGATAWAGSIIVARIATCDLAPHQGTTNHTGPVHASDCDQEPIGSARLTWGVDRWPSDCRRPT